MATDKKSFVLYSDLKHTIDKLPNEKAGELFKHILSYVNDENPQATDLLIDITFEPIKQQLKRDLRKYEGIKIKRSEAGKKSAELRQQKTTKSTSVESVEQKPTNPTVSVNVNDTVNVNVIKKSIEERKEDFTLSLNKYLNILNNQERIKFIDYWTEHAENGKKMRFEKEKVFNLKSRIQRWLNNKSTFSNNNQKTVLDKNPENRYIPNPEAKRY